MRYGLPELLEPVDRAVLRAQLQDWIDTPLEQGGLSAIELQHVGSRTPALRAPFVHGETEVDKLKERIARAVETDAANLDRKTARDDGAQLYVLHAFFGEDTLPTMHMRMRCRWSDAEDEGGPSASSLKGDAILRKHASDAMVFATKSTKYNLQHTLKALALAFGEIERKDARIEKLETELDAAGLVVQDAEDRKDDRAQKRETHAMLLAAGRETFDMVKLFGPALINHVVGDKVFPVPEYAHPVIEQMTQLYDAITTDEKTQSAVLKALGESKKATMAFGMLISKIEDFRELAKARAALAAKSEAETAAENATVEGEAKTTTATAPKTNGHRSIRIIGGPFSGGAY